MNFGPHYLVLFLRHATPDLEVCDGVPMSLVNAAMDITDSYGARWGELRKSACIAAPRVGEVRVQVGAVDRAMTHTDEDAQGYAMTSIVTIQPSSTAKTLAHELSHAQGVGHVCEVAADRHQCPFASLPENMRGHLMYPDSVGMGLDVTGMRWALRQVYD